MFKKFFDQMKIIELYESILDSIGCGIVMVDEKREIMYANSQLKKIYGNVTGKKLSEIIGIEELPKDWAVSKTLKDKRAHESEIISGKIHFLVRAYPLKDHYTKNHAIVLIEEITYKKPFEYLMKSEAAVLKNLAQNNEKLMHEYNALQKKMKNMAKCAKDKKKNERDRK